MDNKYKKTINLKHDEIAAKINARTGEVFELVSRSNNLPSNKEIFFKQGTFVKHYDKAWDLLLSQLSDVELRVVLKMSRLARMNSNSLAPLDNDTSERALASEFQVNRRIVGKTFRKLYSLGVYGSFKFTDANSEEKEYWVLNPYISFKGKTINKGIADLFRKSMITLFVLSD